MLTPRRPAAAAPSPWDHPLGVRARASEVSTTLLVPAWPKGLQVELVELTAQQVRLRVPNEWNPQAPVGRPVSLHLAHAPSGLDLALEATLTQVDELPVARSLTARWSGRSPMEDPRVARLFDRRISVRVAPDPAEPVRLVMHTTEPGPQAAGDAGDVLDVSTGGAAVVVSARFERSAAPFTHLQVRLTLPGSRVTHAFRAEIRQRLWQPGGQVRYGLRFELDPEGRDRRACGDLAAYVSRRQAAGGG